MGTIAWPRDDERFVENLDEIYKIILVTNKYSYSVKTVAKVIFTVIDRCQPVVEGL